MIIVMSAVIAGSSRLVLVDSDAIPLMTSNTTPSGVASASSVFDVDQPFRAMDNNNETHWQSASQGAPWWIQYEFPAAKIIQQYTIRLWSGGVDYVPFDWEFQAWDGSVWVTLDTRVNVEWSSGGQRQVFTCSNEILYTRYRIFVTRNNGRSRLILAEIEMMEVVWQ